MQLSKNFFVYRAEVFMQSNCKDFTYFVTANLFVYIVIRLYVITSLVNISVFILERENCYV